MCALFKLCVLVGPLPNSTSIGLRDIVFFIQTDLAKRTYLNFWITTWNSSIFYVSKSPRYLTLKEFCIFGIYTHSFVMRAQWRCINHFAYLTQAPRLILCILLICIAKICLIYLISIHIFGKAQVNSMEAHSFILQILKNSFCIFREGEQINPII